MTLELNDLLGISAGALTAASRVPQIAKTWKTRSAGGLSLSMYAMLCVGFLLWLSYGLMTANVPVILSNVVSLAFNLILLVFRFRYGSHNPQ